MHTYLLRHIRPISATLFFFACLALITTYAVSHSGGMTGRTQRPGDSPGCTCHCGSKNIATKATISTNDTTFEVGNSYTFTITVTNADEVNAGCDISVWKGSLDAGDDGLQKIIGQLTHTSPKPLPATWTFTYNAPSKPGPDTIYATANAVNGDGVSSGCLDDWNFATKFVVNVTAPSKSFVVGRTTIDFGKRRVGAHYLDTTILASTGNTEMTIASSKMKSGIVFSTSPTAQRVLNVGSRETDTITFAPVARGVASDSLLIFTDVTDAAATRVAIYVTGTGIQAVYSGSTSVAFGAHQLSSTTNNSYSITNSGDDTLFLDPPKLTGDTAVFSVAATTLTLAPGAKQTISLAFTPTEKRTYAATMTFAAQNGVAVPSIALSGSGINSPLSLDANTLDFGSVDTGASSSRTLAVTNGGGTSVSVTAVDISGSSDFSLDSPTPPFPIAGSDSVHVALSFHPHSVGRIDGTLTLTDALGNTFYVALHGVGLSTASVAADPAVQPTLRIYPNPANDRATLVLDLQRAADDVTIEYFDAAGRQVGTEHLGSLEAATHQLSLRMPKTSGTLLVRIVADGKVIASAVVARLP